MKKILVVFTLVVSIIANAQTEHLKFKGVPIDGTISEFTAKLSELGFTEVKRDETKAGLVARKVVGFGSSFGSTSIKASSIMKGDFAGYKDCSLHIYASQLDKELVSQISVKFPSYSSWEDLYANYLSLKSMLKQKYGRPKVVEKFDGYSPIDDSDCMINIKNCRYKSVYRTNLGTIELSISGTGFSGHVLLKYIDKVNSSIDQSAAYKDL